MTKINLDSFVCVPVSSELYQAVAARYPNGVNEIFEYAVSDFLERTESDWQQELRGIRWGKLFLPEGTLLRTKYLGDFIEAKVGDEIVHWAGNEYSSVASLANAMRNNTSNNAWKVIEVKRPSDTKWQLGDFLR